MQLVPPMEIIYYKGNRYSKMAFYDKNLFICLNGLHFEWRKTVNSLLNVLFNTERRSLVQNRIVGVTTKLVILEKSIIFLNMLFYISADIRSMLYLLSSNLKSQKEQKHFTNLNVFLQGPL